MGTRSITEVRSSWDGGDWETNAVIYRHWDGYPSGHGKDLYKFLEDLVVVNGLRGDAPETHVNGPGRLAARLVAYLQDNGHDPDLVGRVVSMGQEFHYRIDIPFGFNGGDIQLTVFGRDATIFEGSVEDFGKWLETLD